MKKKVSLIVCAAMLFAAGVFAASICAQKRTTDAPADAHQSHTDARKHADCPMKDVGAGVAQGSGHDAHAAEVEAHGESAMGFSQTETTHHFRLTRKGGFIQVEANDSGDALNRERIRQHLAHVSKMFAGGDFNTPMLVHGRTPPGAAVMERLKAEIGYAYEKTEKGGRILITTKNPEAVAAVHEFLRFQIEDHRTGDPTEVKNR
ncbi:MAG: hypothetical protein QOJ70_1311 [Acidobacteriota bacterium]|jgi:hypothetical protein|nr:hypothetical protein [Acidobacteriota bacterium]